MTARHHRLPPAPRRAAVVSLAVLIGGLALAGCARHRPYQIAVDPMPVAQVEVDGYGRVRLPPRGRVLLIGDDLVGTPDQLPGAKLKAKPGSRDTETYAVRLAAELGPQVEVISRTTHGARVGQVLNEFAALPPADVIILTIGPGDMWGRPVPVPAASFSESLRQLLAKAQATGKPVIVVPPPPVKKASLNIGLYATYRAVVRVQAGAAQVLLVEPGPRFSSVRHVWSDGIHLAPAGSRALANFIAAQFVVPTTMAGKPGRTR